MKQKDRISPLERLNQVRAGLQQDKSQRAMAKELGCDEGTIRRDIAKLQLPDEALGAIEQGAAAEQFFRKSRIEVALQEREQRLQEERATEAHSDAVAETVLSYLFKKDLVRADEVMILDMVDRRIWQLPNLVAKARRNPARALARCEGGSVPADMPERIEQYAVTVSGALVLIAPEKLIRDRAVTKIKTAVESPNRRRPRGSWSTVR
jgi:transposase-like protein